MALHLRLRFVARALLLALAFWTPVEAQQSKADLEVARALAEGREVPVIVRFTDADAHERGRRVFGEARVSVRPHQALRALRGHADTRTLRALLDDTGVAAVSFDAPVTASSDEAPIPTSIETTGALAARQRYGVSGEGIAVAVIDSGIQPHADLPVSRIAAFVDFVNGRKHPYDDYGHGTHVAGLVAGTGASSNGEYAGAAPATRIVALKVLDESGTGTTSDVIAALEWVKVNAAAYKIRVVNISLGHPVFERAATDPLVLMVEELVRQGLVVVTAAGNMGLDRATGDIVYGSVQSPGNAPSAITVGAAHTQGTLSRLDDAVTDFSGRGPTRFDRDAKPDLVAPGYAVVSLDAPGSWLLSHYAHLQVMPGYLRLNGTSMAAPIVAGAAALMLDGNEALSAHAVKAVLQFTSQRLQSVDTLSQGAGVLNVAGAVRLALLIEPSQKVGQYWLRSAQLPNAFDLLFGETARWSKRTLWGDDAYVGDALYVHLRAWDDALAWSSGPNIVWSTGPNIVWSTGPNIVWSTGPNIVWSTGPNIVWSTGPNIVWSTGPNIVWSTGPNIVWSTGPNIVWSTDALVSGLDDQLNMAAADDRGRGDGSVQRERVDVTHDSHSAVAGGDIVWSTSHRAGRAEAVLTGETR